MYMVIDLTNAIVNSKEPEIKRFMACPVEWKLVYFHYFKNETCTFTVYRLVSRMPLCTCFHWISVILICTVWCVHYNYCIIQSYGLLLLWHSFILQNFMAWHWTVQHIAYDISHVTGLNNKISILIGRSCHFRCLTRNLCWHSFMVHMVNL